MGKNDSTDPENRSEGYRNKNNTHEVHDSICILTEPVI